MHVKQVDKDHTPHLFYLPRMTPHPDWVADTDYVTGDKVSHSLSGREYVCIINHISTDSFIADSDNWDPYGMIPYTDEELVDHPVFDIPHLEEVYASGKGMRRRAKIKADAPDVPVDQTANARLQKITGKQHFFVDGYYDGDPIYTWELIPEY